MNLDPQIATLIEALDAGFPPVAEIRDETIREPGRDIRVRIYRPCSW